MPIPQPNAGEGKDEYISRCMGNGTMVSDYPEQDMRAAVCYSQWDRREVQTVTHGARREVKAGETIRKAFTAETKAEGGDSRRITFTITTGAVDRERDVIDPKGWRLEDYKKNPVVLFAHDYKSLPIARAVDVVQTERGLTATAEFMTADLNPMAETVFRMVKGGWLNATSVGMRPVRHAYNDERGGYDFMEQDLLEFSVVPVPANQEALVEIRGAGIDLEPLRKWVAGAELLLADRGTAFNLTGTTMATAMPVSLSPFQAAVGDTLRQLAVGGSAKWNRQLSKAFDIDRERFEPGGVEIGLVARYLDAEVKRVFQADVHVPTLRMGSFLAALDERLADWRVDDVRNLDERGRELPPLHEAIQLNSTLTRDYLVAGTRYMRSARDEEGPALALKLSPSWSGLWVTVFARSAERGRAADFVAGVFQRAAALNFLKGEAFSLSGEFLGKTDETWDDVFLEDVNRKPLQRLVATVNEQGGIADSRGFILMGPPGTGKTLAGRVILNSAKATFIWVSARDFYHMGAFGGLEYAFEVARECAPAILFFEDVDAWLGGGEIDLLKTEMDGISQSRGVMTILTTNYPERLPAALIDRPGRFHDVLRFGLPGDDVRHRMLATWLPELSPEGVAAAVAGTVGYSGAHVRELARFVRVVSAEDQVPLDAGVARALAKLKQQREMISEAQLGGSRYRPSKAVLDSVDAARRLDLSGRAAFSWRAAYGLTSGDARRVARDGRAECPGPQGQPCQLGGPEKPPESCPADHCPMRGENVDAPARVQNPDNTTYAITLVDPDPDPVEGYRKLIATTLTDVVQEAVTKSARAAVTRITGRID